MIKFAASIMLIVYFVVSTGFVVSVHYCMDEVSAVQLGASERDGCGKCDKPVTNIDGCCKSDVKMVKVQADQLVSKLVSVDFSLPAVAVAKTDYLSNQLLTKIEISEPVAHGPPLSYQNTYLRNCVFRI